MDEKNRMEKENRGKVSAEELSAAKAAQGNDKRNNVVIYLSILFAICVLLIVFSLSSEGNINRRNFARSYWCAALVGVIVAVVIVILLIALGGSLAAMFDSGMYY